MEPSVAPLQPAREIRVFISSTFRDMQAERDELAKFVFPELRKLCQERGVMWSSVDLRWGITEEDATRAGVLSICLDEIHRCRPFFIGILGERYGWVPGQVDHQLLDREPWLAELQGCSITELEILHGVLNDPEMADHAFFYFRDPAYIETLPHGTRQSYREGEGSDSAKKLSDLKMRIRASDLPLVENYPNPRALGEHVKQDLTRAIDELFPVGAEPGPLERERLSQETFAASRSRGYVARRGAFEQLDRHITDNGPPLTITGASGSGKTALLANWVMKRQAEHPDEFIFMHLIGSTTASVDWVAMLRRCIAELQVHFGIQEQIADDHDELRVQFANWLSMAASHSRILLVIDALDQLEDRQGAPDLVWLPKNPPGDARILLSTLPGRPLEEIHKRGWPTFELALLDVGERMQVTEAYLALIRKRLSNVFLERIAQATQTANPLFLRTLLDELRIFGEHERLAERIDHYLEAGSIEELFERILVRYEQDYNRDRPNLVQDAFSLICAARRGLSESELLDLLGAAGEPLPRAYWSPFHLVVEPLLVNRTGLLGFFHSYLRDAVRDRYLPSQSSRNLAHSELAEYFEHQILNTRKIEELPWQYLQVKSWDQLAGCLGDPDFLHLGWDQDEVDMRLYWTQLMEHSKYTPQEAYSAILETPSAYFETLGSIASLLYSIGAYDEALAFQTARIDLASVEDRLDIGTNALNWKAIILENRGEFIQAGLIYKELEKLYRDVGDDVGLINVLNGQAIILKTQGDLQTAFALHREQEQLILKMGDRRGLTNVLHNEGVILFLQGKYAEALHYFERVGQILREYGDKAGLANNRIARASVLIKQGKSDLAWEELNQAEEIQRKLGDKAHLKVTLGNQAILLRDQGRLEEALAIDREAEQISLDLDDKDTLAASLNGQALVLKHRGDLQGALKLFTEAESVARQLGAPRALQAALANQASILHQLGQLEQALPLREEEIEICRRAGYREDLAKALFTKAELLYDLRQYEDALPLAQEAYDLAKEVGLEEMIEDLEKRWFPQ